jgi:hypothetical protein
MGRKVPAPLQVPGTLESVASSINSGRSGGGTPSSGRGGELVEMTEGWWRAAPADGGRTYYWHRKSDRKQYERPVFAVRTACTAHYWRAWWHSQRAGASCGC